MADWITAWMDTGGYFTVGFLMFLENLFPPIPSEIVMPLAGYFASQGELSLALLIIAGVFGTLVGALFWYFVGVWVGLAGLERFAEKYGRLLTLAPQDIQKADAWFDRYGGAVVFFGRLVPGVRTFISIPAGIAGMSLGRFLLFTTAGTLLWTTLLAVAGYWLGDQYESVSAWLGPVSKAILAALVVWYIYRVATFGKKRREYKRRRAPNG